MPAWAIFILGAVAVIVVLIVTGNLAT